MDFDYDLYEDEEVPLDEEDSNLYSSYLGSMYEDINDSDFSSMKFEEVINSCLKPILIDAFNYIYHILLWSLIFRISTQILKIPTFLKDAICLLTGLTLLHILFSTTMYYIVSLTLISYLILFITTYIQQNVIKKGPLLIIFSIIYLIVGELWLVDVKLWHKIRGPQMIVVMKAVSLGFDYDIGTLQTIPSLIQYSGYMLCPGTSVFGPWTSFNDYLSIYKQPKWNFKWLKKIFMNLMLAFIFLSVSTCWCYFIIPDHYQKWLLAYRDALSFRSSHYFISYLSEASSLLSGFSSTSIQFGDETLSVVKPEHIELPRSLINVVVYWNIPMHNWLKIYVFNTSKKFGNFFAIISTYSVSALIHGLNFQLGAVLISLGMYSYIEFMLRKKLANIFNACILVRSCKQCTHKHISKNPFVLLTNTFFTALTVFHLAYLGVMFDTNKIQEDGYDYQHTIDKWSSLDFASHYVVFITYIVYYLI